MESGKLRHRIIIETASESRNDFGDVNKSWSTVSTVWACVEPLNGRELFQAQQIDSETTHKITMRYLAGLTSKNRIKFGTRYFNIDSIINTEERNKELVLMCKEG